ncbi:MAG: hypothetical protein AAF683_00945 [Pseudomonadota bacterium]
MRLSFRTVSCMLAILLSASAANVIAQVERESDHQADLGEQLDALFDDAISGGLLQQRRTTQSLGNGSESVSGPSGNSDDAEIETIDQAAGCDAHYLFDYSNYRNLTTYSDLPRSVVGEGDSTASENTSEFPYDSDTKMAKSYLALGLLSEAIAVIRDLPPESRASLTRFVSLFDAADAPDISYFEALGECRDDAELWLAIALKNQDPERTAALMETNIQTYRFLPFRLRLLIATKTVPELMIAGEKLLAEKLLRGFTPEEIEISPRLTFIRGLLNIGTGTETPELILRNDLFPEDLRDDVISVLLRTYVPESENPIDIRLIDVLDYIDRTENVESRVAAFLYALEKLVEARDYKGLKDLALRPSLDIPEAQAEIKKAFGTSLLADLNSDSSIRQFNAMEVLLDDPDYFSTDTSSRELYVRATRIARHGGNTRLASLLSSKMHTGETADRAAAENIFRIRDAGDLQDLASQYPGNPNINRIAGINALNNGDIDALRNVENRLLNDPIAILDLLEADVLNEEQHVSEALYQAAEAITDPDQKSRADRIFASRSRSHGDEFSPDDPEEILAQISEFLELRNEEVE